MMPLFRLTTLFAIASAVGGTPLENVNVCTLVNDVVSGLHNYPPASSFCSNFLSIKTTTVTSTSTVTPSKVVVPNSITNTADTVYTTSTISTDITVVSATPVFVTPTETVTTTFTDVDSATCLSTATTFGVAGVNKRNFGTSTSSSKAPTSTSGIKSSITFKASTASTSPTSKSLSSSSITKAITTPVSATKLSSSTLPKSSYTVPANLQSWSSSELSTACSCLSLSTPSTTTVTTTTLSPITGTSTVLTTVMPTSTIFTTITSTITQFTSTTSTLAAGTTTVTSTTTTATLTPTGLTYYYYYPEIETDNYQNVDAIINGLSENPNYRYTGTVQNINSIYISPDSSTFILPNSANVVSSTNFALIFQGYLYASAGAGTYSISSPSLDDTGAVWVGTKAYGNGWNYDNADYVVEFPSQGSVNVQLAAGEAVPVTIYFENAGGTGQTDYEIVTPDRTAHLDTTPFFVGACDGAGFEP